MNGPEAHAHEVLALGRGGRFGVVHGLHERERFVHEGETGFGGGDARSVCCVAASGGGTGEADSHRRRDRN